MKISNSLTSRMKCAGTPISIPTGRCGDGSVDANAGSHTAAAISGTRPAASQQQQRSAKKIRSSAIAIPMVSPPESLALLTEVGIANFRQLSYDVAEKCFSMALCRIDVGFLCTRIHLSMEHAESGAATASGVPVQQQQQLLLQQEPGPQTAAHQLRPKRPRSEFEPVSQPGEFSSAVPSATLSVVSTSLSSNATKTITNCALQKFDYDEGMNIFCEPLSVDDSLDANSISAMLFYNIGQVYSSRKQYSTATIWFERSLTRSKLLQGVIEPSMIVKTLASMAHCYFRLNISVDAMQYCRWAMSVAIQNGLSNTEYMAAPLNCIGVLHFYHEIDDTEKSMNCFLQALEIYRTQPNGETSLVYATVLNNIGRLHYLRGEYNQALLVQEEALAIRRRLLGSMSLDVAATVYNIGQSHHQLGNYEDAMALYTEFLSVAKMKLGSNTRDVAIVYKCMAEIHNARSEAEQALQTFQMALRCSRAALGNVHPEVASILNSLGNLSYEMQNFDNAMNYYKEGLIVERAVYSPSHPHISITMTNIAHIHKFRGKYGVALATYQRVHSMQLLTFGPNSMEVANTLSNIGLMQYHLHDYDNAFASYQEALRIRRDFYQGTDSHADIASTLNSIGLVCFKSDMLPMAKSCFLESLRIRQELFGRDHRDVAILWYNLATIHFEMGEDDTAVEYYKETLRVEEASLGNEHPDVVLTLQHIGQVLQQLGHLDSATDYFSRALSIERRRPAHSQNPSIVGKILNLIGNIWLQQGNTAEMMKYYTEASRIYEANKGSPTTGGETLVIAGYNFYGLSKTNPPCAAVA